MTAYLIFLSNQLTVIIDQCVLLLLLNVLTQNKSILVVQLLMGISGWMIKISG